MLECDEIQAAACLGKEAHETRHKANRHIKNVQKRKNRNGIATVQLEVYQCEFCRLWHVGGNPRKKRRVYEKSRWLNAI
jgi:hypothetical protein